jgi:hypothetical protein
VPCAETPLWIEHRHKGVAFFPVSSPQWFLRDIYQLNSKEDVGGKNKNYASQISENR